MHIDEIKVLTDWQPWATLLIIGAKGIETRGWATNFRGLIAIHSAKKLDDDAMTLMQTPAFQRALATRPLTLGTVLGTIEVTNCVKILKLREVSNPINGAKHMSALLANGREVTGDELAFGDYSPGRFAWITTHPQPFTQPVPARGAQGLWTWRPEGNFEYASSSIHRAVPG
jgi:hypothetical protein